MFDDFKISGLYEPVAGSSICVRGPKSKGNWLNVYAHSGIQWMFRRDSRQHDDCLGTD